MAGGCSGMAIRQPVDEEHTVWVDGGFVTKIASIPLEGGLAAVVRFAEASWKRCVNYERARLGIDRDLSRAEQALRSASARGMDTDVAVALASVQSALKRL